MKILFYSHTGTVSGAENIMLMVLRRLNRAEFTPVVVCPEEGSLTSTINKLGIECANVGTLRARFTWRPDLLLRYLISFIRTIASLRKFITNNESELIHANSIRAGLVATAATVGTKMPVMWVLQDALPNHPISTAIRLFVMLSGRIRLMPVSKATLRSFRGRILRHFGKDIPSRVIHNAVELENFTFNPQNRIDIQKELELTDEMFVCGIVGQITPRKGQLELIESWARLGYKTRESILLVVGKPMFDGDHVYFRKVQRRVKELGIESKVRFLGMRNDVSSIMQTIDLLIVNSKSEALVVVAIEAMACGTPVLATDVGGTTEIISHLENGWIIDYGDQKALENALLTLSEDKELRDQFSARSLEVVNKGLRAEGYMKRIEDYYRKCAAIQPDPVGQKLATEN